MTQLLELDQAELQQVSSGNAEGLSKIMRLVVQRV